MEEKKEINNISSSPSSPPSLIPPPSSSPPSSSLSSSLPLLASKRWTVEKKKLTWEEELNNFRNKQRIKLKNIRLNSKKKILKLYEKIFTTIRWSIPLLPSTYCKLVFEYCDHLMGPLPETSFEKWNVLIAWQIKFQCSSESKVTSLIQQLLEELNQLVLNRDKILVNTIIETEETTEKLIISNEGKIKWHMETMHNKRDDYWTIWYLSKNGKVEELKRFLSSFKDIDERDSDFGYTALHYACRWNQFEIFQILLNNGANILLTIPEDQRTPLHLASAYGTREMVLELLARGADYSGIDKYGFTSLDLAIQNNNYPVVQTLKNWIHLVPPEETIEEVIENINHIPEEYLSTPYEVLLTMSPPLRVITTRLEGIGKKHSLEIDLSLEVELRLCEKRSEMCLLENFKNEALKSKKRMWSSAKREYLKNINNQNINNQNENENEKKLEFTLHSSYLASICLNLYSFLMNEKDYLSAQKILSDGLITLQNDKIRGKRERVEMLTRYCELLMYHYDKRISRNNHQINEEFNDENEIRYGDLERGNYIIEDFKKNITNESKVFDMTEEEAVEFIANNIPSSCLSLDTNSILPSLSHSHSLSQQQYHHNQQQQQQQLLNNKFLEINEINNEKLTTNFSLPVIHNSFIQSEESFPYLTKSLQDFQNIEKLNHEILLKRIEKCLTEGIELMKIVFQELDTFIESIELSPLLELMSECLDRMGKYEDALHYRLHASTIKERVLGQDHPDTVACLIECLRLTIRKDLVIANKHIHELQIQREEEKLKMSKYALAHYIEKPIGMQPEDRKNFSLIGLQATEVSRRLDKLIQLDQEAAIRLSGKCYQLVALTDLIVAGELDPTTANTTPREKEVIHHSTHSKQKKSRNLKIKDSKNKMMNINISNNVNNMSRSISVGSLRYLKNSTENNIPTVNLNMNILNYNRFETPHGFHSFPGKS